MLDTDQHNQTIIKQDLQLKARGSDIDIDIFQIYHNFIGQFRRVFFPYFLNWLQ